MIQVLWLPGWAPASLNSLLGHHMKAARLKSADREMVRRAVLVHDARKATGRRKVDLHLVMEQGRRRTDPDSAWKSCLDSLVSAGLLVDDNPTKCVLGRVTHSKALDGAPWGTFILLEDVT